MRESIASATAYLIAESTVLSANTPALAPLIPPGAAELCGRFIQPRTRAAARRRSILRSPCGRIVLAVLERFSIPGLRLHYALRKKFLEAETRTALGGSFEQVVVFGAGFDTLALRLAYEYPHVQFIEVDHPATQAAKKAALGESPTWPGNLQFVAQELTRGPSLSALTEQGYRTSLRTFFIAEGLLMYLTQAEVANLFAFVRDHSGADSRFAFTFMEGRADGRIRFRESSRLVDLWLRWRGEPFKWSLDRSRVTAFLREHGFAWRELATPEFFRRRYLDNSKLRGITLAAGEFVCVADVR